MRKVERYWLETCTFVSFCLHLPYNTGNKFGVAIYDVIKIPVEVCMVNVLLFCFINSFTLEREEKSISCPNYTYFCFFLLINLVFIPTERIIEHLYSLNQIFCQPFGTALSSTTFGDSSKKIFSTSWCPIIKTVLSEVYII